MENSILPLITELERIYKELATKYGIKAEQPLVTIQTRGRQKNTLGWFWDKKWQQGKNEVGEINICAENLNNNPIETLVHEMVHFSNTYENIKDCNSQQYHNRKFKERAEMYGLNVEKDGRHGWAITSLSKDLEEYLKGLSINYKLFELARKENLTITAPTKMKKFTCGCTIVRCATELNATCKQCGKVFQEEE
jgi:hypothetical protein